MSAALHLAVGGDPIPDYPDELMIADFDSHSFVMVFHRRWLQSRMFLMADPEVKGVFWDMVFLAYEQRPVGSLPTDTEELCALLRLTPREWRKLNAADISPLHGWQRYRASPTRDVWGHPVIIEACQRAISSAEKREAVKNTEAERKRIATLKRLLAEKAVPLGLPLPYVENLDFVGDLHARLDAEWPGAHRKGPNFEAVFFRLIRELGRGHFTLE